MRLPWNKESKVDPIEREMEELAKAWAEEDLNSDKRKELLARYMELDARLLEHKKVKKEGGITPAVALSTGTSIGLALLTLNFERFEVLRSKVTNLWLRRPGR